jgi:sulfotransferase 6B1
MMILPMKSIPQSFPILPPVVINCMPKSGTHLIQRFIKALPLYRGVGFSISQKTALNREDAISCYRVGVANPKGVKASEFEKLFDLLESNRYVIGHIPYSEETMRLFEKKKCVMLVILRDPRDIIVSMMYYFLNQTSHYLHSYISQLPDIDSRLMALIDGIDDYQGDSHILLNPVGDQFMSIYPWSKWEYSKTFLFEQLIGNKGGGSDTEQARSVDSILKHINYVLLKKEKSELISHLYSHESPTFRKGVVGDWKNYFTPAIEQRFIERSGLALENFNQLYQKIFDNKNTSRLQWKNC